MIERPLWPNGARCAVLLTFDNFGESYDLLRYGHAGGANADGVYAPRRGIERILNLLERFKVPATFFAEGWNATKYASLAREISHAGHEIGGHGWMHEQWNRLSVQLEKELIKRTTEAIGEATGRSPRGWRSPGGTTTINTLGLLLDAGYTYDSSFVDDDIPYLMDAKQDHADSIIELPWSWSLDDAIYYSTSRELHGPSEVASLWIEEFDAAAEQTGYFILVCHPRYSGRPANIKALERLVEHIALRDDVWFARCEEVAAIAVTGANTPHYRAPESMPERLARYTQEGGLTNGQFHS